MPGPAAARQFRRSSRSGVVMESAILRAAAGGIGQTSSRSFLTHPRGNIYDDHRQFGGRLGVQFSPREDLDHQGDTGVDIEPTAGPVTPRTIPDAGKVAPSSERVDEFVRLLGQNQRRIFLYVMSMVP